MSSTSFFHFSGQKPIITSLDARGIHITDHSRLVGLPAVRAPLWVRGFVSQIAQSYADVDIALRGSPIGDLFCSILYIIIHKSNLPQAWGRI